MKPKTVITQSFTVKNYKKADGVSMRFFEEGEELEIEGPFGIGLNPSFDQVYVAFAAGTGILTFMDLVERLAHQNLGIVPKRLGLAHSQHSDSDDYGELCDFSEKFKLHLYVSFPSAEEAVGLELC